MLLSYSFVAGVLHIHFFINMFRWFKSLPFSKNISHKYKFFIPKRFYYYNNLNKRNIIFRFFYNNFLFKSHMYYINRMLIFSVLYTSRSISSIKSILNLMAQDLYSFDSLHCVLHDVRYFAEQLTIDIRNLLAFFHNILYLRLLFSKFIQFLYYDRMFYLLKNVKY